MPNLKTLCPLTRLTFTALVGLSACQPSDAGQDSLKQNDATLAGGTDGRIDASGSGNVGDGGPVGGAGGAPTPGGQAMPGGEGGSGGQAMPGGEGGSGGQAMPGGQPNPGGQAMPGGQPNPGGEAMPGGQPNPGGEPSPPDDPFADGCPDEVFLDVASAPGAGPEFADPTLTALCANGRLLVTSNGLPHYTFVRLTPNALVVRNQSFDITLDPQLAAQPSEIPLLGVVGFTVNGLPFYGPNEAAQPAAQAFGDPVYNGIVDECRGHTSPQEYHYHALEQRCLTADALVAEPWRNPAVSSEVASPVLGFALDGFPIYGPYECEDVACARVREMESAWVQIGDPVSNAWDAYEYQESALPTSLDRCNGHLGPDGGYHYHATSTFPYILGCYAGAVGGGGGPIDAGPQACIVAADCVDACPDGSAGCTCANTPMGQLCVPTCRVAADCPADRNGRMMICSPNQTCVPAMRP